MPRNVDEQGRVSRTGPLRVTKLRTRLTLRPGQDGTKRLVQKYGARLLAVRYRYDAAKGLRLKTVELVEESQPWTPRKNPNDLLMVVITFEEVETRAKIKAAGGRWCPDLGAWEISRKVVRSLKLQHRVLS